jgi:hypothetical protein
MGIELINHMIQESDAGADGMRRFGEVEACYVSEDKGRHRALWSLRSRLVLVVFMFVGNDVAVAMCHGERQGSGYVPFDWRFMQKRYCE